MHKIIFPLLEYTAQILPGGEDKRNRSLVGITRGVSVFCKMIRVVELATLKKLK